MISRWSGEPSFITYGLTEKFSRTLDPAVADRAAESGAGLVHACRDGVASCSHENIAIASIPFPSNAAAAAAQLGEVVKVLANVLVEHEASQSHIMTVPPICCGQLLSS